MPRDSTSHTKMPVSKRSEAGAGGGLRLARFALVAGLLSPVIAPCAILSPVFTNADSGRAYLLMHRATWTDSDRAAMQLGGRLATVRNEQEQTWIFNTFAPYGNFSKLLWIGFSDTARHDHFVWSSGERAEYTYWASNEPNNTSGTEHYAAMYYAGHSQQGKWNDWRDRLTDSIGLPFHGVVELAPGASALLIPNGAVWKFNDTGANLGTAWRQSSYDDGSWASGPAPLGYGDDDEATVVSFGPNPDAKYITTYFRHRFEVPNPEAIRELVASVLRDDGVVVYLNGMEVFRQNMPAGEILHTTRASVSVEGADETWIFHPQPIDPSLLLPGKNVMAVEVHQSSATSSDISFDLLLLAKIENLPPVVNILDPIPGELLSGPRDFRMAAAAHDDGSVTNVAFFLDGVLAGSVATPPFELIISNFNRLQASITAIATDNEGASSTSFESAVSFAPALAPRNAIWRYWDSGSDLGTAWRTVSFDDSAWASGPAELGYGDGDEATVLNYGPNPANKPITTYFRHAFSLGDISEFTRLVLFLLQDDGAVVYLNGIEVARENMPAGNVTFTTRAATAYTGSDERRFRDFHVPAEHLRAGKNVLAVEVHQESPSSSDLSFNLELLGLVDSSPPRLMIESNGDLLELTWSAYQLGYILEAATDLTPPIHWEPIDVSNAIRDKGLQSVKLASGKNALFFRLRRL
jgi:hypothetical protein